MNRTKVGFSLALGGCRAPANCLAAMLYIDGKRRSKRQLVAIVQQVCTALFIEPWAAALVEFRWVVFVFGALLVVGLAVISPK